jgi:hypothetical protein
MKTSYLKGFRSRGRVAIDASYPRTLSVIVDTGDPGAPRPEGCEILDALEML